MCVTLSTYAAFVFPLFCHQVGVSVPLCMLTDVSFLLLLATESGLEVRAQIPFCTTKLLATGLHVK